ncbi:MAG: DUF6841 family protein [Gemmatimonadaceae bacterium]
MRPAPTPGAEDREVQGFLDKLGSSLTAGDARTVATMWAVPAYVIGDNGAQVVNSRDEVEQFFSGAKEQYNKRGITDTRAEIFGLEWLTDRIVVVDVRWPYLDARGEEKGGEASTYTLRRDDNGELKLHIALMRGEEA